MSSHYSRVTGILSFYDEPLELLAASVSSQIGVIDHLVAIDGAYMLFPDAQPRSDPSQMRLIEEICNGARIGLTAHTPVNVWGGNEVEKRNHAIKLAEVATDPNGWYLVLDSDCVVTHAAGDWFEQVARIPEDFGAAMIDVREVQDLPGVDVDPSDAHSPVRLMYRALRGMTYGPAHWIIHAPDPETSEPICFWGPGEFHPIDAYDLTHLLKIDHRRERPEYRRVNSRLYYSRRDQLGVESLTCVYTKKLDGTYGPRRG